MSNIAYLGISKEDYYNENFVFDVYLLLTKNLNPLSLDRKLADKTKREMIYMVWKECVPTSFYTHICKEQNFLYLDGKNQKLLKLLLILLRKMKTFISNWETIYQVIKASSSMFIPTCFLKITALLKKEVLIWRATFTLSLKHIRTKKMGSISGEKPRKLWNNT